MTWARELFSLKVVALKCLFRSPTERTCIISPYDAHVFSVSPLTTAPFFASSNSLRFVLEILSRSFIFSLYISKYEALTTNFLFGFYTLTQNFYGCHVGEDGFERDDSDSRVLAQRAQYLLHVSVHRVSLPRSRLSVAEHTHYTLPQLTIVSLHNGDHEWLGHDVEDFLVGGSLPEDVVYRELKANRSRKPLLSSCPATCPPSTCPKPPSSASPLFPLM